MKQDQQNEEDKKRIIMNALRDIKQSEDGHNTLDFGSEPYNQYLGVDNSELGLLAKQTSTQDIIRLSDEHDDYFKLT